MQHQEVRLHPHYIGTVASMNHWLSTSTMTTCSSISSQDRWNGTSHTEQLSFDQKTTTTHHLTNNCPVHGTHSNANFMSAEDMKAYKEYEYLLDKSSEARAIRDYKLAHHYITQAIQLQPTGFKAYYRRALLCWRNGQMIDTYRAMNQALFYCQLLPEVQSKYWTLLFEGCIAELNKDLAKAEKLYSSAIEHVQDIQRRQAYITCSCHRGSMEAKQSIHDTVVTPFDDKIQSTSEACVRRRLQNFHLSNKHKSISLFLPHTVNHRSAEDENNFPSDNCIGDKDPPNNCCSCSCCCNAVDSVNGFEAYLNMGIVKMEQTKYDEAIAMFCKSLKQTNKLNLIALCYNNIACCYVRQMNDIKALYFFTKGIETYPYDVLFYVNRMRTNRRLERFIDALNDCNMVISLTKHAKTLAEAYADKADILRKMKKIHGERALVNLINNDNSMVFNDVANKGNCHELICKYYEKSIAHDPTFEYSYLILAAICADHNQMDRALAWCEKGIKNCRPDDWQNLKELYRIRSAVYALCIAKKNSRNGTPNNSQGARSIHEPYREDNEEMERSNKSIPSEMSNTVLQLDIQELIEREKNDRLTYERLATEVCNRIG
jgi:tetratricopeptide (TPR) repeat protein